MEVFIAFALIGGILLAVISLMKQSLTAQTRSFTTTSLDVMRKNLISQIEANRAWVKTLADTGNTSFACIRNHSACTQNGNPTTATPPGIPLSAQPFRLRDAKNAIVFDALNPAQGFTPNGALCTGFSTSGNDACPFRYDLTWSAICTDSCVSPQVKVRGQLVIKFATTARTVVLNPENYSFEFTRGTTLSGALQLVGLAQFSLPTGTPGYIACGVTLPKPPTTYIAKGSRLVVHTATNVTAAKGCLTAAEYRITGPDLAIPGFSIGAFLPIATVGSGLDSIGNISSWGSSQVIYEVTPGSTYTIESRVRTLGGGTFADNKANDANITIHDYLVQ